MDEKRQAETQLQNVDSQMAHTQLRMQEVNLENEGERQIVQKVNIDINETQKQLAHTQQQMEHLQMRVKTLEKEKAEGGSNNQVQNIKIRLVEITVTHNINISLNHV